MDLKDIKRIGLFVGREWSWPSAFINAVNEGHEGVVAEFIKIGASFADDALNYDAIVDRMSHEIPYYGTALKAAALRGVFIINNPFMAASDDKFFGISLARDLGIDTPKTVALPNKRIENENVAESFRNLVYPMDWQGIIDHVGVPAILKDIHTGGRRVAHRVHNVDELIRWYDESDTLTVVLQEIIEPSNHLHCFVVGRNQVLSTQYLQHEKHYSPEAPDIDSGLLRQCEHDSKIVTRAYGYDINMVEFVIREGSAYLINPSNPSPELDIDLLTADNFNWCVRQIADFAVQVAKKTPRQFQGYDWQQALESAKE